MPIPFLDLTRQYRDVEAEINDALMRVISGGAYILGSEVEAFEVEWANFCSVRGAASVANGTDALSLALTASGAVRKGQRDEVITTPLTAAYTALAILNAGGVPIFADINPRTYTLDSRAIEEAITPRTRAIIPVHLYGQMADMPAICAVAARHHLIVIEDAAQAHGARLKGRMAGADGHAAAFSFYPTKNLGAFGDGGAVVSNDPALIERIKLLRQGGHEAALASEVEGRNSRLDEIQAAILRVKLKRLENWNQQRRRLARIYDERFTRAHTRASIPQAPEPSEHVYHLYVIEHPERDRLRAFLAARGIETLIHYPYLLHQQTLFRQSAQPALAVAEHVQGNILSLPLYAQLSIEEANEVADAVLEFDAG
ncbi:MAG: DegT/DnrJ/EryC1/StrS family aminotransferase [Acidobacteria bacterium]|nr:DegT/DnrJ/EryC1/StrS family aminotransferase [Acidobacteriota bacterium]